MLAPETKVVITPTANPPLPKTGFGWKAIVAPVEPFLEQVSERLAVQVQAFDPEIAAYARYALTNQGKQLRPALVALSGRAAGQLNDSLVTVAVIIEMVHLATLVHDDVMDEAEIRRRQPTMAANWGNEISVLLGDCLFAHALKLAASFPTPEVCRAVASATNTVCSGEILQTNRRRNFQMTRGEYFKVLEMKTAELFALSCELGARLSGGSAEDRALLRQYGMALGTAYQIFDDCLDLFGSEATAGKSLGTDLAGGKLTLPVLAALEHATPVEREQMEQCIRNWKPVYHDQILALLEKYHCLEESQAVIQQYLGAAQDCLGSLAPSHGRDGLAGLLEFLAQQTTALGGVEKNSFERT
ncbi:MAG: polyprenyl synthetase family protein [Verrucomicrobiota bacterium]